ncbi:MAG TPA: glutathione S-transferase N-terminal domain-containing protein [Thermoleophilia bacterium]|nr:glutathione S-transferase N-terminal domain-containing protein [Thermoleophilia bacterium]
MITLYQTEWCPYSHRVRQVLTELDLTYTTVCVPYAAEDRVDLLAVAGQTGVPVLTDGDGVYRDSDAIIAHLRATYPAPEDAGDHAAHGAWRTATQVAGDARSALARLKTRLDEKGFVVLAEIAGSTISRRLPDDHVVLQVTVPVAAAKAAGVDPLAPAALMFPMAVVPQGDDVCTVAAADPVGQVWLHAEPDLIKVQGAVKKRLEELLATL